MDKERENTLVCDECHKKFSTVSARNRHLRDFHGQITQQKSINIICPICPTEEKTPLKNYEHLITHLTEGHGLNIKESNLNFKTIEDFQNWRSQADREVNYTTSSKSMSYGITDVNYNCNRSNTIGSCSIAEKRAIKAGGSIKISGVCPSRICVRIMTNGNVMVKFIETHVGHEDEMRTKRLTTNQQKIIVDQLKGGVAIERILLDARKIENQKLERVNLIKRRDLQYLMRKFNIDKKRDADDMVATILKIEEWNKEGKNQAFLVKKIGENHPDLRLEDFAVAFMNKDMEQKLRKFRRLICIDGTHGTNRHNWDLTTVLIKDDQNMDFPVAFLLSNRLDQVIQRVFFRALKLKLGEDVEAEYIMSDDDPKYYNAWTEIMRADNKPRRLLCTWHVIKNWNIQGRSKIKKQENKFQMKMEMRKILKEINAENFVTLKENYFKHLEEEGEMEFLKYLQNYYFQSEERIKMWAHCHRINAGINTNMAIESLHKVLKHNKINGKRNIRVEKLLDLLEELVDEKMWKRILNTERPDANNYQHKTTTKAHKLAEERMTDFVELLEFGKFKVKSWVSENFFFVSYKELCNDDCRRVYCEKCKVCVHRYECECPEFCVKSNLCKHIHAVALYEKRRSESVLGSSESSNGEEQLCIDEPTTSKIAYQEELNQFINNKSENKNESNLESYKVLC